MRSGDLMVRVVLGAMAICVPAACGSDAGKAKEQADESTQEDAGDQGMQGNAERDASASEGDARVPSEDPMTGGIEPGSASIKGTYTIDGTSSAFACTVSMMNGTATLSEGGGAGLVNIGCSQGMGLDVTAISFNAPAAVGRYTKMGKELFSVSLQKGTKQWIATTLSSDADMNVTVATWDRAALRMTGDVEASFKTTAGMAALKVSFDAMPTLVK